MGDDFRDVVDSSSTQAQKQQRQENRMQQFLNVVSLDRRLAVRCSPYVMTSFDRWERHTHDDRYDGTRWCWHL